MAREEYELSPQTKEVVDGHVQAVANGANWSDKFLYAILAGSQTDPYPPFKRLFLGAVRGRRHEEARLWLVDLESALESNTPQSGKPNGSVETLLESVSRAYIKLLTAYRNGRPDGEVKAEASILYSQTGNLLQTLDPQRPQATGDEKVRNIR